MAGIYDLLITSNFLSNGGGPQINVQQLDVSVNGTHTAPEGVAYSPVVVNVPNTYSASDEGKVVNNGALVSQTSFQISNNGTYDTTTKNNILVAVQDAGQFDVNAFLAGTMTDVSASGSSLRDHAFVEYGNLQSFTDLNITEIPANCFDGCTNLTSLSCGNVTKIGTYGLNRCNKLATFDTSHIEEISNNGMLGCYKLNITNGILTASTIGQNSCGYLSRDVLNGFSYEPANPASVEYAGLQYANIKKIKGSFSNLGSNAFAYCNNIQEIDCEINGPVGSSAFQSVNQVSQVDFSGSNVTSVGSSAFQSLGGSRTNPSSSPLLLDFSQSSFIEIPQQCFSGLRSTTVKLPSSVNTIGTSAFSSGLGLLLYMSDTPAPSLTVSNAFQSTSNYTVFVPWGHIASYQYATNWVTIWSNIVGYAPANTFTAGEMLPTYNSEGYQMTWYSDYAKTTQITTCPDGSPEIYCVPGASQSKLAVIAEQGDDLTLTITDTNSNPVDYSTFGFFTCDSNDTFTVNASSTQAGWVCYIRVNGIKITSLPYTLTVTENTSITSVAYDPSSTNADFTQATWRQIANAVDLGTATTLYANQIGAEKTITLVNGETHRVRLSNCTSSMYDYADKTGSTGFVVEFCNCLANAYRTNATNSNQGGWDASEMNTKTMGIIYNLLPGDVREVISRVKVKAANGGGTNYSAVVSSNDYLFLPAEREVSSSYQYSMQDEWDALSQWQYYEQHTAWASRIKQRNGGNSIWLLRSTQKSSTSNYCCITNNGSLHMTYANTSTGVSPCFCI